MQSMENNSNWELKNQNILLNLKNIDQKNSSIVPEYIKFIEQNEKIYNKSFLKESSGSNSK